MYKQFLKAIHSPPAGALLDFVHHLLTLLPSALPRHNAQQQYDMSMYGTTDFFSEPLFGFSELADLVGTGHRLAFPVVAASYEF